MCDDHWDLLDANVVCNQLGLGPAIAATKQSFFGFAEGEYILDNVECDGSEDDVLECEHSTTHNCEKNEAAGVICSSKTSIVLEHHHFNVSKDHKIQTKSQIVIYFSRG